MEDQELLIEQSKEGALPNKVTKMEAGKKPEKDSMGTLIENIGNDIFKRGVEVGMETMLKILKNMLENEETWNKIIKNTLDEVNIEV